MSEHNYDQIFFLTNLTITTMDQVWKRKYLNIYFHHRIFFFLGGGEKINLNIFSLPFIGERKQI